MTTIRHPTRPYSLPDRLRLDGTADDVKIRHEAADRIDALEAALREVILIHDATAHPSISFRAAKDVAREALGSL